MTGWQQQQIRPQVLRRDNHTCQWCLRNDKKLDPQQWRNKYLFLLP